ncbi:MAG: conjugal transfer protein TraF [Atopostipes suicloacalis]|nr:conjugal transfer protein TraF [Atopostipes suicloacalis]MDN6731328.1 conjugal transfer protein TraF [Atopostipes suicloacalis]
MALTEEEKEKLIKNYEKNVSSFQEVGPEKADELLEENSGQIVFIGFNKCPYCQKFVDKFGPLAEKKNLKVYYINARDNEHQEAIKNFRDKYDVPTVPGLLYSSESAGLVVKSDSSLSEDEILEIIEEK